MRTSSIVFLTWALAACGPSASPKPPMGAGDSAFADVQARAMLPIHWGTFDLAEEPLAEPPRLLEQQARTRGLGPDRVWIFKHGETRQW